MRPPETTEQALTLALLLGITAPDDEQARWAADVAEDLASGLDAATIELCKAAALEQSELENFYYCTDGPEPV